MLGSWHGVDSVSPLPVGASGGMADALASGASVRKDVGVQVPPRTNLPLDLYTATAKSVGQQKTQEDGEHNWDCNEHSRQG